MAKHVKLRVLDHEVKLIGSTDGTKTQVTLVENHGTHWEDVASGKAYRRSGDPRNDNLAFALAELRCLENAARFVRARIDEEFEGLLPSKAVVAQKRLAKVLQGMFDGLATLKVGLPELQVPVARPVQITFDTVPMETPNENGSAEPPSANADVEIEVAEPVSLVDAYSSPDLVQETKQRKRLLRRKRKQAKCCNGECQGKGLCHD